MGSNCCKSNTTTQNELRMGEMRRMKYARERLNIPLHISESANEGTTEAGTKWVYTKQRLGMDGDSITEFKIGKINLSSKQYVNLKNPKEGDLKKWVSLNDKCIFKRHIGNKRQPEIDKFENLKFAKTEMQKQADIEGVDLKEFCNIIPIKVPDTIYGAADLSENNVN